LHFLVATEDLGFNLIETGHGWNDTVRGEERELGGDVGNVQDAEKTILD
jgi:beta-lactamase superfamily II metal-dependent hydrolase